MVKGGLPFLVSVSIAGVVAMAIAFAVGTPTLRLRGAYFAIGTLALAESAKQLALAWDRLTDIPLTGGSAGISLPLSAGYLIFYYVMLATHGRGDRRRALAPQLEVRVWSPRRR